MAAPSSRRSGESWQQTWTQLIIPPPDCQTACLQPVWLFLFVFLSVFLSLSLSLPPAGSLHFVKGATWWVSLDFPASPLISLELTSQCLSWHLLQTQTHTHSSAFNVSLFSEKDYISHRCLTSHLLSSLQCSTSSLKQGLATRPRREDHWNPPWVEDQGASQATSCHRGVRGWSFTFSLLCLSFHHGAQGLSWTGGVYCYLGVRVCQCGVQFHTLTWTLPEKYWAFLRYGRVNKTLHTWAARNQLLGLMRWCWILWCSNLLVTCACVLWCTHARNKCTSRIKKKHGCAEFKFTSYSNAV